MPEILDYDFMQRALLASLLVGLTAPVVGVYLVQRRLALIGDGLGHIALTGVALGLLTGTAPVPVALACAIAGAVAIELVRVRGRATADVLLAVMFYGGIAGGVVLLSLAPRGQATNLEAYLFGAITTTTTADVAVFGVITVVVLGVVWLLGSRLYAVSDDEEYARAVGLPVLALNIVLAALVAATVVLSMRVVGLLLISALMIVPNAVGQVTASSFRASLLVAVAVGVAVSVSGTAASFYVDTPSGATIVLLAIGVFLAAVGGSAARSAVHARRRHHASVHRHEHGPECGHEALVHGDHVDYVHDGHRHAEHGGHYDEH